MSFGANGKKGTIWEEEKLRNFDIHELNTSYRVVI